MADHPECLVRRSQKVGASILVLLVALASATPVRAQNVDSVQTARAEDVLARVRKSSAGDVQAARALADSLVSGLPADATVMPEALFAKASIAASAAEAERDYARIVTEYRFSARVPDALMRLAILESARNNRVGALRHLDRLLRDHGGSPVRSRASLMAGRMRMDMNDPARACDLLAAAYASAGPNERDVIDQAQTAGATCPTSIVVMAERDPPPLGIARAPRTAAPVAVRSVSPRRAAARRDSISARTATSRLAKAPSPAVSVVRRDAVTRATSAPTVVSSAPPVAREAVTSSVVEAMPSPVAPSPRREPAAVVAARPAAAGRYGVQFAAYNDRPGAAQLAGVLQERGISARVEGTSAPFRVRAGRFTTRAEAEAAAVLWRRGGQAVMIVPLGPTP